MAIGDPAPTGAMIAPMHLSDLAQLHFQSIASMLEAEKRASPHYAEHVALLAMRLEQGVGARLDGQAGFFTRMMGWLRR